MSLLHLARSIAPTRVLWVAGHIPEIDQPFCRQGWGVFQTLERALINTEETSRTWRYLYKGNEGMTRLGPHMGGQHSLAHTMTGSEENETSRWRWVLKPVPFSALFKALEVRQPR